jgi:hypothetical protein
VLFFLLGVRLPRNGAKARRLLASRSGVQRQPKRSAAAAEAGASPGPSSRPDSEVVAKAKRRTFPMEYKIRILEGRGENLRRREAVEALRKSIPK